MSAGYLPVCPIETETNISYQEAHGSDLDEIRAYKLGKRRWSYNQVELLLSERGGSRRLGVRQAVNMGTDDFGPEIKDSAVSFQVVLTHGGRLHLQAFLCFDTTEGLELGGGVRGRRPATLAAAAAEVPPNQAGCYQWVLVSRAACCKGCSGPVLRAIQRFGKLGKRTCAGTVAATEESDRTRNNMKDPRYLYLSFDEATTHVAARCFRLVLAAFDQGGQRLLGTAVSPPVRVLANNDVPTGAAHIQMVMEIGSWWEGWANAGEAAPLMALPRGPRPLAPPAAPAAASRQLPPRANRGRNTRALEGDYTPGSTPDLPGVFDFEEGQQLHGRTAGRSRGRIADPSAALGRARRVIAQYDSGQADAEAEAGGWEGGGGYALPPDHIGGPGSFDQASIFEQPGKRQRFGHGGDGPSFAAHSLHHGMDGPPLHLLPGGGGRGGARPSGAAAAYLDMMSALPPGLPGSGAPDGLHAGHGGADHDPIAAFADFMIQLQQQAAAGRRGGPAGYTAGGHEVRLPDGAVLKLHDPLGGGRGELPSAAMPSLALTPEQQAQLVKLHRMKEDTGATPPPSTKPLFTGGGGGTHGAAGGHHGMAGGGLARLSSLDKSGAQPGGALGGTGAGAYASLGGADFSPLRLPNTPPSMSTPTPSALDDLFCSIQPTLESAAEVLMNQGESAFGGPASSDGPAQMAGML